MNDALEKKIAALVGPNGLITDEADMAPYLDEWRGTARGKARMVVRPGSTQEVAGVVKLCAEAGVAVVPQGGNTGLVHGAQTDSSGQQVIVNLSRMNRIRELDPINFTMTVESGVVLKTIQDKAEEAGCLFPLSLGAEGSCQIGGNISTNAGGVGVLRYGNTRALILGVEVVLPDGRIWDGLKQLGKDNTGYDLKQLFIGAEGTLGIVTSAVLKLFPAARETCTVFCGLTGLDAALKLLTRARAETGDQVSAFELMPRRGIDFDLLNLPGVSDPLSSRHDWYVLTDIASSRANAGLRESVEEMLAHAIEAGEIADAVIAESIEQTKALWRLREEMPEALRKTGDSLHHDVSVPTSQLPEFIRRATREVEAAQPGVRPVPFGHVGDGNIHFSIIGREGDAKGALNRDGKHLTELLFKIVADMRGSFSAEHGIGRLKTGELAAYKSPVEIEIMQRIKGALDPKGTMNPGKVVTGI